MKYVNEGQCRKIRRRSSPQVYEMLEWWSSVKPLGPSVAVEILQNGQTDLGLVTTGHGSKNGSHTDLTKVSAVYKESPKSAA